MDSLPPVVGPAALSSTMEADLPRPLKKFYQGEPLALGITQIFTGISGIVFGLLIHLTDGDWLPYNIIKMPYWSGVLYIISGSLAVAAARNPKMSLVQGMLAMNVISAITAGTGIICLSLTFGHFPYYISHECIEPENESQKKWCYETQINPFVIMEGILAILTIFTILEFCIAISVASFGCKVLCRNPYDQTVVVIYQNVTPANAEHPPVDCKEPESP